MEVVQTKDITEEKDSSPSLDLVEDSGFSSILTSSGTSPTSDNSVEKLEELTAEIPSTSEHENSSVFYTRELKKEEKQRRRQLEAVQKQLADEDYERQIRDQHYKSLMHLLKKSLFYANYISKKITNDQNNISESSFANESNSLRTSKRKKSLPKKYQDDEVSPSKKGKRISPKNKAGNLQEFSPDLKKKLKNKINLNKEEIEKELTMSSDEENIPPDNNNKEFIQPVYFNGILHDYQKDGLQWMIALYENGLNGILADEMGLGKTIQIIALICHLIEKKQDGPYLIVVPLSTVPNWILEFERFAPELPVVLLHGSKDEREKIYNKIKQKYSVGSLRTQPIVITTFEIPVFDKKFLVTQKWRYIVVDEGHRIKNYNCLLIKVLRACKSMNRLILTGTPLQNNLAELWTLLNFLLPELFNDLAVFESWFNARELQNEEGTNKLLKQEEEKRVLCTLREILKPFMLRRNKADVDLQIPDKKEVVVYTPITELQRDLYRAVLNRDINLLMKSKESLIITTPDGSKPKRRCVLRKSLNNFQYYKSRTCNSFSPVQSTSNHNLFSPVQSASSHNSFSPVQSISNNQSDLENENPSVDYTKELKKEEKRRKRQLKTVQKQFADEDYERQVREEEYKSSRENDWKLNEVYDNEELSLWRAYTTVTKGNSEFLVRMKFNNKAMLYKKIINHPYLVYCPMDYSGLPKIDENLIKASGKLLVLDKLLIKLHSRGHKVLLFSTMTQILDVLEDYLTMREQYQYVRLDGSVDIEERKDRIKAFNNNSDIFLFLISTRAGGVGLNLAAADTVIIYDSDWNPQADIQAMARCHRIGQIKPVLIYRLCAKGTIDQHIVECAVAKRKLEKIVIANCELSLNLNSKESLLKLRQLLESSECQVVSTDKDVFNEEQLEKLLDRSDLNSIIDDNSKLSISSRSDK